MNYKKLGNTGVDVSTICLGTMTWGEQNSQEESFDQMDFALDKGINFFDTAEIYPSPCFEKTYGSTEKIIGNWFREKKNRDKVILASKVSGPGLSWVRGGGSQYSEKSITEALEKSLKRLQTDYIDLYQLHWPERKTNFFGRDFNFEISKNFDKPQEVSFDKPIKRIFPCFINFSNTISIFSKSLYSLKSSLCTYPNFPKKLVFLSGQCN